MVRFWPASAAVLASLFISAPSVSAQQLTTAWHLTELGPCIGCRGLIVSDLDGDGRDEILASNSDQFVTAMKWDGGDFRQVWSSPSEPGSTLSGVRLYTPEEGPGELFILRSNGSVQVYSADGFGLLRSGTVGAPDAAALAVADLDGDGTPDIVVVAEAYLRVFDGRTFAQTYATTLHRGTNVEVGDVTGDGVPNIVIGQQAQWAGLKEGYVLNGATRHEEWRYAGGFGSRIRLADVTGNGVMNIVGLLDVSYNSYVRAFDAVYRTPLWELQVESSSTSLLVDDVTGDGTPEIVVGTEFARVSGYSMATRTKTWELSVSSGLGRGLSPFAAGDVVGDGKRHLVYGAGTSWGTSALVVVDAGSRSLTWQSAPRRGPFAVAVGDVTGDGYDELVVASASHSGYTTGTVSVFDRRHRLLASATLGSPGSWYGGEIGPVLQVADVTGDGRAEIFVSNGSNWVWRLDGTQLNTSREATARGAVTSLRVGDLNGDGHLQLVASDVAGYVTVFDAETLQQQWQTVNTGSVVTATELVECEPGRGLDVVLVSEAGFAQAYNGQTGFLRWQAFSVTGGTAAAGADLDRDGQREVLIGDWDGRLSALDCRTGSLLRSAQVFSEPVRSLWVGDLDEDIGQEVVAGTTRLSILKGEDFEVMWQGAARRGRVGQAGLYVTDFTGDRALDFIFAADDGVFHLASDIAYLDLKPPTVTRVVPADGAEHVSRSASVDVYFSKALDPTTVGEETLVLEADGEVLDYTVAYEPDAFRARVEPHGLWPGAARITVVVSAAVADTSGNRLDGNRNGVAEGSPADDFVWAFHTGTAADLVGPTIVRIAALDTLWRGMSFRLEATAADTSAAATSDVVEIVAYLDRFDSEAQPIPLSPVGRAFDSPIVEGWVHLSTDGWPFGDRAVWLRARDQEGNWGELAAVTVHIVLEAEDNWTTYGRDARRTAYNPAEGVRPPFAQAWRQTLYRPYNTGGSAVIANGVVYASSVVGDKGVLDAFRIEDGTSLWRWTGPMSSSIHPPAFGYGLVYVQTNNHTPGSFLYAIDASTGDLRWQTPYSTQWSYWEAPAVSDRKVFVGTGYFDGMSAFDALTGEHLWEAYLPQVSGWAPAVHDGVVYTPVLNHTVWGLDAVDGSQHFYLDELPGERQWEQWSAVIDEELNWAFMTGGGLSAVNLAEPQVEWWSQGEWGETRFWGGAAVAVDQLFALQGGRVVALNKRTGARLWVSAQDGLDSGPIATKEYVYASDGRKTYAFSRRGGESAWTFDVGGRLSVGNGHLVIASENGLYAFAHDAQVSGEEGAARWELHLASPYPNPARMETTIEYTLPQTGLSSLKVYNMLGQVVAVLHEGEMRGGRHTFRWAPGELANGVYLIRLETDGGARTARVVVTR